MADYARLDFGALAATDGTLVPVLLIAGVPRVFVPPGVAPTEVAVSGGSLDPEFWPGTGSLSFTAPGGGTVDPVVQILAADFTVEIFERAQLLKGDVTVEALSPELLDVPSSQATGGQATALCAAVRSRAAARLSADLSDTASTVNVDDTTGMPSAGIASIGREAVGYTGTTGTSLTGVTRGEYGSRARAHVAPMDGPPIVSTPANGSAAGTPAHRYLQGRRASLWLAQLAPPTATQTLTDPTLIFLGAVGPDIACKGRAGALTRWALPIDHASVSLGEKLPSRSVLLTGINHSATGATPLRVELSSGVTTWRVELTDDATAPHNGGWHPSWADFCRDWNTQANAVTTPNTNVIAARLSGGELSLGLYTALSSFWTVDVDWRAPPALSGNISTPDQPPIGDVPAAFVPLYATARLSVPGDLAKIPTTLDDANATGGWSWFVALAVENKDGAEVIARVTARDATLNRVALTPVSIAGATYSPDDYQRAQVLKPTSAEVVVVVDGQTPWSALRGVTSPVSIGGSGPLDELFGLDAVDVVDWDSVERVARSVPTGDVPQARRYVFRGGDETVLARLVDEARLIGAALCVRQGRLSIFRVGGFASTEITVATITSADLVREDDGTPAAITPRYGLHPSATTMRFDLGEERGSIAYTDQTWVAEFGAGETIECKALRYLPPDAPLPSNLVTSLQAVAQQTLGPLAEPQFVVDLVLPLSFFDLSAGDLVVLTNSLVPNLSGTRGVSGVTAQVIEVRRVFLNGRARVQARVMLAGEDLGGYAPEALVAAGGLTGGSAVVTLDTTSDFGAACFAQDGRDPSDGFAAGDKVRLIQLGDSTPIADESFTVVSVGASTVTLNAAPSASMVTRAASAFGVMLAFDNLATPPTAAQKLYAFQASPYRWAS